MSIFEYNKEEEMKKYRQAEREGAIEEGIEIGRDIGVDIGVDIGRERERKEFLQREQELLIRILSKYDQVSGELRKQIEEESDLEVLKNWNNFALEVNSIEEFQTQYLKKK